MCLHKQAEPSLYDCSFRPPLAGPQRLLHQSVINFNIRSWAHSYARMCKNCTFMCMNQGWADAKNVKADTYIL
jgi:hypothetical protein